MQPDIQTTITNVLAPLPIKERLWALAAALSPTIPARCRQSRRWSMAALIAGQLSAG
jgi:hypothetical protein